MTRQLSSPRSRNRSRGLERFSILAEMHRRGLSLAMLARAHGYHPRSFSHIFTRPWPEAQRIVAEALDRSPYELWPDRYPPAREAAREDRA